MNEQPRRYLDNYGSRTRVKQGRRALAAMLRQERSGRRLSEMQEYLRKMICVELQYARLVPR